MRKGMAILSGYMLLGGTVVNSQSPSEEFNQFREQIFSDYSDFKSRILDHYGDFLNGEWHEFEPFWEEKSPYTEPKPEFLPEMPVMPEPLPEEDVAKLPAPEFNPAALPGISARRPGGELAEGSISDYDYPSLKIDIPDVGGLSRPGISASNPAMAGIVNIDMKSSLPQAQDNFFFDFYGMEAYIPEVEFNITSSIADYRGAGNHWNMMAGQEGGVETSRCLKGLADQLGLNGYLTFRLTEAYVNQRFGGSDTNARMSAVHFLLSHMEYDVRLVQVNGMLTVMMPFDQKVVYSTLSTTAGNGRKYTVLYPVGNEISGRSSVSLMTCDIPGGAAGKTSDLRLTGLNLPVRAREYQLSHGGLSLRGEINENLKDILYHYPQMPNGDFASSVIDSELRDDLVSQVRTQLAGKSHTEAVNALMALCHYGFQYKTDQEWHGFEKPYFLEESLLYDYNDCEDRAIFFSYLIWHALGIPCQMVQYPGHESATVAVSDEVKGYYYDTDGTKYYSADPTYIGSNVGMLMSSYRNVVPTIDKHYK